LKLFVLTDVNQIDNANAIKFDDERFLTADMAVAYELERLGIDFTDEWDYLSAEEILENRNNANSLASSWGGDLTDIFFDEFSLTECVKQDLVYPFEAALNASTIYKKIFESFSIQSIRGYFLPPKAVIRTGPAPTSRAVNSISHSILFYFCDKNCIPLEKLVPPRFSVMRNAIPINVTSFKKANLALSSQKDKILLYTTGMPEKERSKAVDSIDSCANFEVVIVSQESLAVQAVTTPLSKLQTFLDSLADSCHKKKYPEIYANKYFLFQFERVFSEIGSALSYGQMFSALVDILKPSCVIFGHEAFTIERVLVQVAKSKNIPTVALLHSCLGFKFFHNGVVGYSDNIFVWNAIDIKWLESYGIEKSRLKKIGSLRYSEMYKDYLLGSDVDLPHFSIKAKLELGIDKNKPVITLLTAEVNTGHAAPIAKPLKHRNALRDLLKFIKNRPDLQFVIKPHPGYDYYDLYDKLISVDLPNLHFVDQIDLRKVLEASDICFMLNYCTTASLEAMLMHKPVIFVNNAIYKGDDYVTSFSGSGLKEVNSVELLIETIDSFLSDPSKIFLDLQHARSQVVKFLGLEGDALPEESFIVALTNLINKCRGDSNEFSDQAKQLFSNYESLNKKHILIYLASAYSFIAGIYSVSFFSIRSSLKSHLLHNKNRLTYLIAARHSMLQSYLMGRIQNGILTRVLFIKLMIFSLLVPNLIIRSTGEFKKFIARAFVGLFIGSSFLYFVKISYRIRDKFF
jgi:hypothetical protein